jgi:hypothetical protein
MTGRRQGIGNGLHGVQGIVLGQGIVRTLGRDGDVWLCVGKDGDA